jgi:SAM-dependent methyltransferase
VGSLAECDFTHAIELPGHGLVPAPWDLRAGVKDYLGGVDVAGKRVLDLGTGSGFLGFAMEQRGARVTAYATTDPADLDLVPFPSFEHAHVEAWLGAHLQRVVNAWWFSHAALGSRARLAEGSPYRLPEALAPLDVAVFGTVLSRLRDPFRALHGAARLTRESLIVTEFLPRRYRLLRFLRGRYAPAMLLAPRADRRAHYALWWVLAPETVREFLRILGFGETRVTFHDQLLDGRPRPFYTVVGRRTEPTSTRF